MTPSASDRRRAVVFARDVLAHRDQHQDESLVNLAATLLLCQHVFAERLAPVYHAAMRLVREDGTHGEGWNEFVSAVQAARERRGERHEKLCERGDLNPD